MHNCCKNVLSGSLKINVLFLIFLFSYKDQDSNLVFLIRGHPAQFEKNDVRYDVIEPNTLDIQLTNHEELIGHIIELRSARPQIEMPVSITGWISNR